MRYLMVLVLLAVLMLPASAGAEEGRLPLRSIKVYYLEFPPYYFTYENRSPGGFLLEKARRVFLRAGIEPEFESRPAKRILQQMDSQSPCASIGWFITPEREEYAVFSQGIYQNQPLQVVYNKEDEVLFEDKKTLSALLEDKTLVLGSLDGYSYGKSVDEAIALHRPFRQVIVGE